MLVVQCSHCGHRWTTKSQAMMVTCPKCLKKTRIRASQPSEPQVLPEALKQPRTKLQGPTEGPAQSIRGTVSQKPGKACMVEDITISSPSPASHRIEPLGGSGGLCAFCHKQLSPKPNQNVLVDQRIKAHAVCVVDYSLQQNDDLEAINRSFGGSIPIPVLLRRKKALLEKKAN
jgi:predicted  nucleic acid-binding Zn-ribbon protein